MIEENKVLDRKEAHEVVCNMIIGIESLIGLHMREVRPDQKWIVFGRVINHFFSRHYGSALSYAQLQTDYAQSPTPEGEKENEKWTY